MIPPFDPNGALPEGQHACEWDEFVERFEGKADNKRRRRLILGLAQVCFLLHRAGCLAVWVDGSFVTRERWPKDFDLCYDSQEVDVEKLEPILRDWGQQRFAQKERFGGEALPHDLPFSWNGETVLEAFACDRRGIAKGLIRLNLEINAPALINWIEARQAQRLLAREQGHTV